MMRAMLSARPLLALVLAAGVASAATPSVRLDELTSPELAARIARGATTILVPIGGTEQNGAHMALGKHNRRAEALAQRIAVELGNAIVAPVLVYVPEGAVEPPTGHMRYAGTISVPSDVFVRTLEAAARSFRAHGFRDIVFLGDHGGYQKDLETAALRINQAFVNSPARAHALADYYRSAEAAFPKLLLARGYRDDEIGRHAGLADTSLTLAIDATLVREDRLQQPGPGVDGNPARATAALGKLGVDLIVARSAEAIRTALARR
jgi:creatinine amidohydrolase